MSTVFITGATGFIGRAVLRELLKRLAPADRVFALVRKPVESADERLVPLPGDLERLEEVEEYVREADFIIHIAGEARLRGGSDYQRANVAPTRRLVECAQSGAAVRRFIFISSIAAMDRLPSDRCDGPLTVASPCVPRTGYGTSKRMAEEIVEQSGLPFTIFRPGFVYGSGMRSDSHLRKFARLIGKGLPLQRFNFPGRISLIHVDDLAAAVARCCSGTSGTNSIYLAGTESLRLGDVLALLAEALTGKKPSQVPVPAMKVILQRVHHVLPAIVAGMFIDYYWLEDADFIKECFDADRQRPLSGYVHDIINDMPAE